MFPSRALNSVAFNPGAFGGPRGGGAGGGVTVSAVNGGSAFRKGDSVTITGTGFGASQGAGTVTISGVSPITQTVYDYISHVSTSTVASAASGNLTMNAPSNAAQNDILIAFIAYRDTAAFTAPTGGEWTQIDQVSSGNTSTTTSSSIASGAFFWCRRGASNPNLVFQRTGGDVALGRIACYRGCVASGSPFDGTPTINTLGSNSATVTTGSITTTVPWARVCMAFAGADNTTATTYTSANAPRLFAERADSNTTTGADTTLAVVDAIKYDAGATGTLQLTAGNSSRHVAMACALKPATLSAETQTVTSWADTSITITAVRSNIDIGSATLTVTNNSAQSNSPAASVTLKGLERYVNTDSTTGGDGTTNNTSGATRAFASLNAAVTSFGGVTLSDQVTIYCDAPSGVADTAQATNTDTETTRANYILVKPYPGNEHNGVWNTAKYRMEVTNADGCYNNNPSHFIIDGLACKITVNNGGDYACFKSVNAGQNEIDIFGIVRNVYAEAVQTAGTVTGVSSREPTAPGDGQSFVYNCISVNCNQGFQNSFPVAHFFNNTAYGCTYAHVSDPAFGTTNRYEMIVRNDIDANTGVFPFVGTFPAGSDYCFSSTGEAMPGSNSANGQTFTFVNAAGKNFQPTNADTGAKGKGQTDPSRFSLFTTDITGGTRSAPWDAGAFKYSP